MQPTRSLTFDITAADPPITAGTPNQIQLAAFTYLTSSPAVPDTLKYVIFQYMPPLTLPPAMAESMPDAVDEDGVISGSAPYGGCEAWGEPQTATDGGDYVSISFTGCLIPDGGGEMASNDAEILAIARALANSNDISMRTSLLTSDFLAGTTDKVSATHMTAMFGVPYNVQTFDEFFDIAPLSVSACRARFDELEISLDNCEGVTSWVNNQMRPAHAFEAPGKTRVAPKYDAAVHEPLAKQWWEVLDCGRQLISYNAQCVEDLDKKEQQFLFDTFADDVLFGKLNDKMLAGEAPYEYSGKDGTLRIYYSEFSRLVQSYFDTLLGLDGTLASLAMIFSYGYIIFHTFDFGVATVGMIHIMMSIPVSLAIYIGPLTFDRFNTLCPLGVFVILGIGADDIFIMVDCWKQSTRYFAEDDLHGRMAWTWVRASHAMLTTTMTTAVAFFTNVISPIAPIAVFGIFSGLLVVINYIFVITWFPAMLILKEKAMLGYYVPAYCGCCLLPAPLSYYKWNKAKLAKDDGVEIPDVEAKPAASDGKALD